MAVEPAPAQDAPPVPLAWRSRIVGQGEESAEQLFANPKNWRTHPSGQAKALAGALNEVGWVQQVIVNRQTGLLIDGHLRVELAAKRREQVPVLYVDLSEDEERLVLATLDPIGAMAGTSTERLEALMQELGPRPDLEDLFEDLLAQAGVVEIIGYEDTTDEVRAHNNLGKINGTPGGNGYVGLQVGDLMVTITRELYTALWTACDDGTAPRRQRLSEILEAGLAHDPGAKQEA